MSGRAGRRGKDERGICIIMIDEQVNSAGDSLFCMCLTIIYLKSSIQSLFEACSSSWVGESVLGWFGVHVFVNVSYKKEKINLSVFVNVKAFGWSISRMDKVKKWTPFYLFHLFPFNFIHF